MYGVRDPRPVPFAAALLLLLAAMGHSAARIQERWPLSYPFFDAEGRGGYFFGIAQGVEDGRFELLTDVMDRWRVEVRGTFSGISSGDAVTVYGIYRDGSIEATGSHVLASSYAFVGANALGILALAWAWRDAARRDAPMPPPPELGAKEGGAGA